MIAAFLSGMAGEAGRQWAARVVGSALVFWSAGLALVWYDANRKRIAGAGWLDAVRASARAFDGLPAVVPAVVLPAAAFLLIAGSAVAADRLTLGVLRLLEGYWARPRWLREWLVGRRFAARGRAMATYQRLQRRRAVTTLTAGAELELSRAFLALRGAPARRELTMPTRLGNLLRVTELRPARKHGVDTVALWPHLWLVMPADTRAELAQARQSLDTSVRGLLWGALFVAWTPWSWWAPVVALVAGAAGYRACLGGAAVFGSLVEAAFDVHLPLLYAAARMAPPPTAADEAAYGARLSRYLSDGSTDAGLRFDAAEGAPDGAVTTAP